MVPQPSRYALVALALLQAMLLYGLGNAVDTSTWPATVPSALLASYLLALGVPLFLYLAPLRPGEAHLDLGAALLLAGLLLLMGWHTGRVLAPELDDPLQTSTDVFAPDVMLSAALLVFVAALLYRAWREHPGSGLPWRCQLDAAWGNALTLALVFAFVLLLWLLLWTWAALFSLIGIDFFRELFRERAFRYAATGLAGGIALVLVRSRLGLVTALRGVCETLARVLLPLAAVIVLGFALTLPFAGVDLLWQEGRRPTALLWLTAFTLFFLNAALGDEGFSVRLRKLQWLTGAAVVALLPLLAVTLVGLLQRVGTYGWTLPRLWAAIVIVALAGYALAASWSLIRHRALQPQSIGRWNTVLALALLAMLVAVHSPAADLRRFAAADQLARVLDGRTPPGRFDADHLYGALGRYGRSAFATLQASELAQTDAGFAARLEAARVPPWRRDQEGLPPATLTGLLRSTSAEGLPEGLLAALAEDRMFQINCRQAVLDCRAERVVFEGAVFWFAFAEHARSPVTDARAVALSRVLRERDGAWESVGLLHVGHCGPARDTPADEPAPPALLWLPDLPGSALQVGDCRYPVIWLAVPEPVSARDDG